MNDVIDPNLKVRKSNVFVDGRYRFNLNEQKILLLVISRIRPKETEFVPYRIPWSEIKQATNGKVNTVNKIHSVCESLKNKTVIIKKGRAEVGFGFLSGWTVEEGKYLECRIDPGMKELLLDLLENGNFTLYDLECILSLNSTHSIRIYEIMKSLMWKKGPVVIPLEHLKWNLDIPKNNKSYTDFGNFRRFVLERAEKDLKAHTDVVFTYTPIKEGRRIVAIEVTVKDNKKFQRTIQGSTAGKQIRNDLKAGDIVIIAGKEYEFDGACIRIKGGAMPTGPLQQLIKQGKAKVKK